MEKIKLLKILGLLVFLLIIGCRKETIDFPSGIYINKVIYHQNVDQIRHYNYNNRGLLSSREFEFNDRIIEKFEYTYVNGEVNRIDFFEIRNNNDFTLVPKEYLIIEYESGSIVKATRMPDNITVTFSYNNSNQIVKSASASRDFTLYDYDLKGNIIHATVYKDDLEYWKFFYEYDNMNNPFYNVEPIHETFGGLDLLRYKCQNNIVKSIFINENQDTISESEFVYKYDSNKLPVESYELFTSKSNGYYRDSIHTQLYVYEIK